MPRWLKLALAGVALLVVGVAGVAAVTWARLPDIVADRAGKALGRNVRVGALHLSPGQWLSVDLRDTGISNLPGGTRPEMAVMARMTGEVALWPLLRGTLVARSVRVEGADILLEKVNGQPNWRNGPKQPEEPGGGRASFPTLLGVEVQGVITFRTSSGAPLVTKLDGVKVEVTAADQPVKLAGPGSYQGVPVMLDLKLGSYNQLHDQTVSFPADIRLTSGDTLLHFSGTMTKPLDVDGAEGRLSLEAPTPGVLEKVSGAGASPAPPLRIDGAFRRDGDLWQMRDAKGALGQAALEDGTLRLQEGSTEARTPDKVDLALRFGQVDVDRLLAAFKGGGESGGTEGESSFVPQAEPNPQISARLEAAGLTYEKLRFASPKLAVTLEPRLLKLDGVSFGALGGQVKLEGQVRAEEHGNAGALTATLTATGLEVSDLRQALGMGQLPLSGRMDVHATAEGAGPTAARALTAGRASVVATMGGGSVSAQVVDLASQNVAGLLRPARTMVPLTCLLAAMDVHAGIATLGVARLRSTQGTVVARGRVDLLRETLDMVVASEARTTGALALDVPVRVSGRLNSPSVAPAGDGAGQAAMAGGSLGSLPASLRPFAQRSGCAG